MPSAFSQRRKTTAICCVMLAMLLTETSTFAQSAGDRSLFPPLAAPSLRSIVRLAELESRAKTAQGRSPQGPNKTQQLRNPPATLPVPKVTSRPTSMVMKSSPKTGIPEPEPISAPEESSDTSVEDSTTVSTTPAEQPVAAASQDDQFDWLEQVRVGYDGGFIVASEESVELNADAAPFLLKMNGWGQLRHTILESQSENPESVDVNQFQLKRARLIFSGSAFTDDFAYFVQLDGRSSSGDDMRLLDYFLAYDIGRHAWGWDEGTFVFKTGKYKMPFHMARYLSGREFEFTDRSVASMFFDVNRSLAWGLFGERTRGRLPLQWELAIFNGLVTGGAETGSSGTLDDNFAYSMRFFAYPLGDWGNGQLADFDWHQRLATRVGAGVASSRINENGSTEFNSVRVVDSGEPLSTLLPESIREYEASLASLDGSAKWRGWSANAEMYFRLIRPMEGSGVGDLFDHGFWLQLSKFLIPDRLQLLSRWSRVQGDSGTLGEKDESADEIAGGFVWYFRDQHAKFTCDATYLNGAPINSASLGILPGDAGWLVRSQIQFAY